MIFNDLYVGPYLGVTEPEDIPKHWEEMQKYHLLPLMEDRKVLCEAALPFFPPQFQDRVKSVLITIGYKTLYTA